MRKPHVELSYETPRGAHVVDYFSTRALFEKKLESLRRRHIPADASVRTATNEREYVGAVFEHPEIKGKWCSYFDPDAFESEAA